VRIALDPKTVAGLIADDPPHLRERMDEAIARGDELVMSSLVLHDVAFAAMASDQAAARLAQVDAFVAQVEVVPWTSEDALTAARLRADHERTATLQSRLDPSQILCAAQALNNDWTMIAEGPALPRGMRSLAPSFGGPFPGLRTIDWSTPSAD
jgi:predicted nucleic acid-binding protein